MFFNNGCLDIFGCSILKLTQKVRLLMADHMLELFSCDSLNYLRAVTFVQLFLDIMPSVCQARIARYWIH